METVKVSIDFSTNRYSDKELNVKANYIIDQMTDNSFFPEPNPTLVELKAGNDSFVAALIKMEDGNKQNTIEKNNRRAELEMLLQKESVYVQQVSNGSDVIIATSGFDTNKKRTQVGALPMVVGLTAKAGAARGSLEINWIVLTHARVYEVKYTEAPSSENSVWIYKTVTKHHILIEGLIRGNQYAIKVAGAGSDPSRIWSDEITSFVM